MAVLRQNGDLRVWSVIVTIFGDLAQGRDDAISGTTLSRLCKGMAIKPQAMRVALHRLRKDGWIDGRKIGRTSDYRLTKQGYAESLAVRPRIYSTHGPDAEIWHLAIGEPMNQSQRTMADAALNDHGYVNLTPGTYLGIGSPKNLPPQFLTLEGAIGAIPDWLKTLNAPADLAAKYTCLNEDLTEVLELIGPETALDPLEIATLRVLIVHNWRRLLLRHADLPDQFYPTDWPGYTCRQLVAALLKRLDRPHISELE